MRDTKSKLPWVFVIGLGTVPAIGIIYSIAHRDVSMLWISCLLILIPLAFAVLGAGAALVVARVKKSRGNEKDR